MALADRQKEKLNEAVAEYLRGEGYAESAAAFEREAMLAPRPASAANGEVLKKKWSLVLRLSKKVEALEAKLREAETQLALVPVRKASAETDLLPEDAARFELKGHRGGITAIKFHPIFAHVLTSSEDGSVRVWDAETGASLDALRGHADAVNDLALDGDGTNVLTASSDTSLGVWNYAARSRVRTLSGHEAAVTGVCVVGDRAVSASRDGTARVWIVSTGFCTATYSRHAEWVRRVVVAAGLELAVSCSSDRSVHVWSLETGETKAIISAHTHVVECVALASPTANAFVQGAGASADDKVRIAATGGRDNIIAIHDVVLGAHLFSLDGHSGWVRGLAFHPCGRYLLSVSDDKTMRVWDLEKRRCIRTYDKAHKLFVCSIDFASKTPVVATGDVQGTAKLWFCKASAASGSAGAAGAAGAGAAES